MTHHHEWHITKSAFFCKCKSSLTFLKNRILYHIDNNKQKIHMNISINAKIFNKSRDWWYKTFRKQEMKGDFPNLIKYNYKKIKKKLAGTIILITYWKILCWDPEKTSLPTITVIFSKIRRKISKMNKKTNVKKKGFIGRLQDSMHRQSTRVYRNTIRIYKWTLQVCSIEDNINKWYFYIQ